MKPVWCCISPNRVEKSGRVMKAVAAGWPGARVIVGAPPDDGNLFFCFGQIWLAEELIVKAIPQGRQFFQIDNGFWHPSRGQPHGYYRFMYSRPDPVLVTEASLLAQRASKPADLRPEFKPLRKDGEHILIGMPGEEFGRAHGLKMRPWMDSIVDRIKAITDRPIRVRDRMATNALSQDLRHCWAVVTHSSNIAVDAIIAGIPVFCEPTCMALPVGKWLSSGKTVLRALDKEAIEKPHFPTDEFREKWWWSLMCQQFTFKEMSNGSAHFYLSAIHGLPVAGTVQ
jgi:hypothetical protein